MAMTNAQRQAAWRERQRAKLEALQAQPVAGPAAPATVPIDLHAALAKVPKKYHDACREVEQALQQAYQVQYSQWVAQAQPMLAAEIDRLQTALNGAVDELSRLRNDAANMRGRMNRRLDEVMTQDDYRLVIGCLHPDRHPPDMQARMNKAFDIVKRLETSLGLNDKRRRKGNGWE